MINVLNVHIYCFCKQKTALAKRKVTYIKDKPEENAK